MASIQVIYSCYIHRVLESVVTSSASEPFQQIFRVKGL